MGQPIVIAVDTYVGAFLAVGFMIPVAIAGLAGGYCLAGFVLDRFGKTVLGTHVRHFFTRIAPRKRFDPTDRSYVEEILRESLRAGRIKVRD